MIVGVNVGVFETLGVGVSVGVIDTGGVAVFDGVTVKLKDGEIDA